MDKNEQIIERLAKSIKGLEMKSLLAVCRNEDVREVIEELNLVPVASCSIDFSGDISGDVIIATLEELGYPCRIKEDSVSVETDDEMININFEGLPMVSVMAGYHIDEIPEGVNSMRQAANEVTTSWDMVKAFIDPEERLVLIFLDARHEDVISFKRNIQYYIKQVVSATKDLKNRYNDHERDRMLLGLKSSKSLVLS